ncbi:MAG: hypothetical protein J6Y25_00615 [Elusimicrobiaceae bacterium]|nr:hypothetical protein [Elusimicrobiaceae bacterium]
MNTLQANDQCEEELFFVPGCLGTCWYGKYHYLEPFTGCEHDCVYCYAKGRSDVLTKIAAMNGQFTDPQIGMDPEKALAQIAKEIEKDPNIHTIKLSRYTDIFSKKFVANGFSYSVLKLLAEHPQIKRIIITTKGVPNEQILELIKTYPQKFSYSAAIKPTAKICMETNVPPQEERIRWASLAKKAGALVTVHMDPLIVGYEDTEEVLRPFFAKLKEADLNRVMFSYLLYDYTIAKNIIARFGQEFFAKLKENYLHNDRQILPLQQETTYYALKHEVKLESVKRISSLLNELGFEFVVCGLKSSDKEDVSDLKKCSHVCDGKFYA